MSYSLIKGINFKNGIVNFKCASSNVYPKDYTWVISQNLTDLLNSKGSVAVKKEILLDYWGGEFQPGIKNNYSKSVEYLQLNKFKFNWSNTGNGKLYSNDELKDALYQGYLDFKNRKKGKFIVQKRDSYYVSRKVRNGLYLSPYKYNAKVYPSKEEAILEVHSNSLRVDYKIIEEV